MKSSQSRIDVITTYQTKLQLQHRPRIAFDYNGLGSKPKK
jgi:hypothetical protein